MAVLYPLPIKTYVLRLGITVCLVFGSLLFLSQKTYAQRAADERYLESFNVTIGFGEIGSYIFPAFYEDPDGLYLPVSDMLNLFKIVCTVSSEGQVIKGYVETEDNVYQISYPERFIQFKDKKTLFSEQEALMDMGTLYIKTTVLKEAFGFTFDFSFRTLTAKFASEFVLPVVKLKKQEKTREKIKGKEGELAYDTILPRDYHWFKGGMMDWSVASTQSSAYTGETRMELGGGAEIFGGETNVFLNWSDKYGMNREQQQYYWRWADNDARLVKQVQVGRVSNRSIASLLSPVDGFFVTNTPTTVRKALGTYEIADYTEPDWVVELYVNNVLISYTRSDASGFYKFDIPIVYGTSNIMLRFYGPGGEVRSEEKQFNMPYNMLPKGELEYRVSGGTLMDSLNSLYGRAEVNYGVARWLTAGAGIEYLTSISNHPEIPFVGFTFQPFSWFLMTGEYAHNVRTKGTVNLTLPGHSVLDVTYALYDPDQEAIIYNYLQERSASLSLPYRMFLVSGYTKATIRQNIYSSFEYNSAEWMVTGNYSKVNLNLSNFVNWTNTGSSNLYANLAMGLKIGRKLNIRPSAQYNYTSGQWISVRGELESRVFTNGYASLRYENNLLANTNSINLTFRYDFPFMSAYTSGSWGNKQIQTSESAKGSFAFGSGNKYVYADKRGSVGRSGVAIDPFLDINFNGIHDKGEPSTEPIRVRCSGGQVITREKDSIIRVVGLEPFVEYTLMLDESSFQNLAWHLPFKTIKLTTDPNQFKTISVAVHPMGEVSGLVVDEQGNPMGRVLVTFTDKYGNKTGQTLSESDGYFTYVGFKPDDYWVGVDTMQLRILKMTCEPVFVTVKEDVNGDLVDAGELVMIKKQIPVIETVEPFTDIDTMTESLLRYFILFDHDKTVIRAEYIGTLQQLTTFLKANPSFSLEIQGHTDSDGSETYNQLLSERRAAIVKQYLISSGVSQEQLEAIGYGETRPANANLTEAEKAANRRVTFDKAIPGKEGKRAMAGKPELKPTTSQPTRQELEVSSMTGREMVVARKEARDMVFLELGGGNYIIQFGAFKSQVNAKRLADKVNGVLDGQVEIVNDNGLYKVQTPVINGVEETVKLAKQVRVSDIL